MLNRLINLSRHNRLLPRAAQASSLLVTGASLPREPSGKMPPEPADSDACATAVRLDRVASRCPGAEQDAPPTSRQRCLRYAWACATLGLCFAWACATRLPA